MTLTDYTESLNCDLTYYDSSWNGQHTIGAFEVLVWKAYAAGAKKPRLARGGIASGKQKLPNDYRPRFTLAMREWGCVEWLRTNKYDLTKPEQASVRAEIEAALAIADNVRAGVAPNTSVPKAKLSLRKKA